MKVEVDLDTRVIQVGDFRYSLDILASGFPTPVGKAAIITVERRRGEKLHVFEIVELPS